MYTCSVNMFTVCMNVRVYLHMCGIIQKNIHPFISHSFLLLSLPLSYLLRLLNLFFILLMTF